MVVELGKLELGYDILFKCGVNFGVSFIVLLLVVIFIFCLLVLSVEMVMDLVNI